MSPPSAKFKNWMKLRNEKCPEIARVNAESKERARAEAKARVREKNNAVQRATVEASAKIRSKAESKKGNIERAEAETKAEAVTAEPPKAKRIEVQYGKKSK